VTARATVDRHMCAASEFCVRIVPELFALDDQGSSAPLHDPIPPELLGLAREAEVACPTGAITIEDGAGVQ
jgi:ferredoxin